MAKQHGGRRAGAGRPPLPAAQRRTIKVTIYLTESEAYLCKVLGNDRAATGVRRMLDDGFARLDTGHKYEHEEL